jgi:tetraacyldisaccharide 4'-kinase
MGLRILLLPVTWLLACVIYTRNKLYDLGILRSTQPDVFTINVGNLNLGGTGKTPHVEYLTNLLSDRFRLSILSRGYKRQTRGFILADVRATDKTLGDEPMQYYLKFRNQIQVAVCEDRVSGVNSIQAAFPDNKLIILDDAFQHRKIRTHLNLLLCDYNRPFYQDYLIPVGKLRDIRLSAERAHAIIVTKCPQNISGQTKAEMRKSLTKYTQAHTPVFFSHIHYKPITSYTNNKTFIPEHPVTVITGIAKPEVFLEYLKQTGYTIKNHIDYPDHFAFTEKETEQFFEKSNPLQQIITTEKDMVKIKPLLNEQELERFFYIPIEVTISDKEAFNNFILTRATNFISKSI